MQAGLAKSERIAYRQVLPTDRMARWLAADHLLMCVRAAQPSVVTIGGSASARSVYTALLITRTLPWDSEDRQLA
jgi:hypothetical protein